MTECLLGEVALERRHRRAAREKGVARPKLDRERERAATLDALAARRVSDLSHTWTHTGKIGPLVVGQAKKLAPVARPSSPIDGRAQPHNCTPVTAEVILTQVAD